MEAAKQNRTTGGLGALTIAFSLPAMTLSCIATLDIKELSIKTYLDAPGLPGTDSHGELVSCGPANLPPEHRKGGWATGTTSQGGWGAFKALSRPVRLIDDKACDKQVAGSRFGN